MEAFEEQRVLRLPTPCCCCLFLAGLCAFGGCANGYASPQALFAAVHNAHLRGDRETLLSCFDPGFRNNFAPTNRLAKRYEGKADSAAMVVKERFGADVAERFRERSLRPLRRSPLEPAMEGGQIHWERVLRVRNNEAWGEADGRRLLRAVRKANGTWFLALDEESVSPEAIRYGQGLLEDGIKHLDELIRRVRAGDIDVPELLGLDEEPEIAEMAIAVEAETGELLRGARVISDKLLLGRKGVRLEAANPYESGGVRLKVLLKTRLDDAIITMYYSDGQGKEVAVSIDGGQRIRPRLWTGTDSWRSAALGNLSVGEHVVHVYVTGDQQTMVLDAIQIVGTPATTRTK